MKNDIYILPMNHTLTQPRQIFGASLSLIHD